MFGRQEILANRHDHQLAVGRFQVLGGLVIGTGNNPQTGGGHAASFECDLDGHRATKRQVMTTDGVATRLLLRAVSLNQNGSVVMPNHFGDLIQFGQSRLGNLIRIAGGAFITIDTTFAPLRDAAGRVTQIVGSAVDITERKKAEEQIYRLNADLEQRVQERTAQLESANKELEAFSYSVSHDLRAPLRAVDGFSQAVLEDYGARLPEEGRRYLQTIRGGAQKMGVLIDDLLTFSRLSRAPLQKQETE